ncbi:helix-turn-helix domain-containing protein [Halomonas sp. KO116]|uniref:helix-turn-helix domain-containing protein n=1 Tax=Halomonas sp. KO116 TaxID=1504981 RepID=UPI0004E2984D|nr:helix-turn-helix domain-containing protein [Halomonas sp. KO116]AJY53319.1 putative conserved protein UCP037266 [Halomonas sp. KO116]
MTQIEWGRLSQPMRRRYLVVAAIAEEKYSLQQITDKTGIPVSSLRRILRSLRVEFGMDVRYINTGVSNGYEQDGYYKIEQWGVFDKSYFLDKIATNVPL